MGSKDGGGGTDDLVRTLTRPFGRQPGTKREPVHRSYLKHMHRIRDRVSGVLR